MPAPFSAPEPQPKRSRFSLPRFQFSLAWLLIVFTLVAVLLGLGASVGALFGTLIYFAICCIVPTPLVICAAFGRGYLRAFAIGALVPWITIFPWQIERAPVFALTSTLVFSVICGFMGATTWRSIRPGGEA